MPIAFAKNPTGTVFAAHCFGNLTKTDISESFAFALGSGRYEPGLDRIVTLDPDTRLHELDAETLREIQQFVLDLETRLGGAARFRSVLVHSSQTQMHVMQLYKAIWDALNLPGVDFTIVASKAEAWQILDSPPFSFEPDTGLEG